MRVIWSGSISFGLVNIPIKLYSASETRELSFKLLNKKDLSPIRYARISRQDGKEVPYDDIVKGYEYVKGDFVVLTDKDFERADVRKTKTIDIYSFTNVDDVNLDYFDKPYFLEPDKGAHKPYALLRESLKRSGKAAIGKFVLRTKELLCVIRSKGNILMLNKLRFTHELREPEGLKLPDREKLADKKIELAMSLVDQLTQPFKPDKYKDEYSEEVKEIIAEKAQGKESMPRGEAPEPTQVNDLMSALKASLEKEKKTKTHH